MVRPLATLALVGALGALAGCGTSEDRTQARDVVTAFYEAAQARDGERACAMLSDAAIDALESQEGEPCPDAIAGLDLQGAPVDAAEVYITNAKVDLASGESAFLSRERDGWRISALACAPSGKPADRPFDCELEA